MDFSSVIKNYSGVVILISRQRCLGFASNAKFSCTEGIDEGVSSTTSRKRTIQFDKKRLYVEVHVKPILENS
jgi:hypothetical protein